MQLPFCPPGRVGEREASLACESLRITAVKIRAMVDVCSSVAAARGDEGSLGLMAPSMSYLREVDMNEGLYMADDVKSRSTQVEVVGFRDQRLDSTGLRVLSASENQVRMDQRTLGQDHLWGYSDIVGSGQGQAEDVMSGNGKAAVTAIDVDAIDNIIGPRTPNSKKSRRRSKGRSERSVSCETCGAVFTSKGNVNRHRRSFHEGVRVYCDFKDCNKVSFRGSGDGLDPGTECERAGRVLRERVSNVERSGRVVTGVN